MYRIFNITLIMLFLFSSSIAQKVDVSKLKGLKFRSIGPAGMSGRVTSIDVVLDNPDIIYAGTASGGLWKSESGGIRWRPIFDKQPTLSIGAVSIDQNNPDVIWAGTGEGNPRNSHNSGAGIYKSLDGGKTWKLMGLEKTKLIHRIIIHRDDPDIVFVAAMGSAWGPNPERGVYKTINGGTTWKRILYENNETGCADLVVDPTNPNKLIAAMWEYGRKPWTFNSGGEGSGLYVTIDGGATWKKRTEKNGLPKGELGRIGLAIAPSMPNIIYALIESKKTGLYKSIDGGFKWKMVSDKNIGNRPFYYADIYVDPKNENRIYNLYSVVSRSEDGGKTFKTILPYSGVHPDHHAFWIHPDDSDYLIDGNDGGLNISRDRGKNWRFVENLPLAQFYHINIDMDVPYNIYGGMQDNGSWVGPSQVWEGGGIRNNHWSELYFGDGFDVVPKPGNSRYVYAMSQGGNVSYCDRVTGETKSIQPIHPNGKKLRFNWNAGIAQDPYNDCGVYFGSQYLHYSTDCGKSWKIISPDLTTNDTSKQKQAKSGGLTIDATRAENFTTILSIAPSPVKEGVIWVGTDDGNLQLTKDGGKTWNNLIAGLKGVPKGSWIPQIEVSKHDAAEAFVIINNYRRNDWKPYVYHTTDYGKTWNKLVDESKIKSYALSIVQDHIEPKLLFLGTENGLYFSIDKGAIWNKWGKDYPSASTMDMKIHPRENDLIIGTFGRAVYVLDDISPLRELAQKGIGILNKDVYVFDSPNKTIMAEYRPAQGVRFAADAHYRASNKPSGAKISFYLKEIKSKSDKEDKKDDEKEDEKKDKKKSDKVKIVVFNEKRDTIRDYTVKPDTGLNRIHWYFNRNGVRYPSHKEPKKDANKPTSGFKVLPGKYKVLVSYNGKTDSTNIEVVSDPRRNITMEQLIEKEKYIEQMMDITEAATNSVNRLKESKKTIEMLNKQMDNIDKELAKELQKSGKALTDSANNMLKLFMTPEGFKGYDHVTERINSKLWAMRSYIDAADGAPTENGMLAINQAEAEVNKALSRINKFYEVNWAAYQKQIEDAKLTVFKEYEPILIEKD
ncbi:MAG: hypothetical protein JKX95_01350 [Bacteroidia bacterium]|nr:hypothetical protein [Bacteroidia bacterium]